MQKVDNTYVGLGWFGMQPDEYVVCFFTTLLGRND